jgi:hypothetical protein
MWSRFWVIPYQYSHTINWLYTVYIVCLSRMQYGPIHTSAAPPHFHTWDYPVTATTHIGLLRTASCLPEKVFSYRQTSYPLHARFVGLDILGILHSAALALTGCICILSSLAKLPGPTTSSFSYWFESYFEFSNFTQGLAPFRYLATAP